MDVKTLNEILEAVDPIGIAWFAPNEYDPEAKDISERLKVRTDTQQVVVEVFEQWFHPGCITEDQAKAIAEAIEKAK